MTTSLWALTTTLLLLFGLCQSQPDPRHSTESTLNRRQAGDFDAEFPEWVYRGETGRTPADVEKDGGFYSRGLQKQRANVELPPKASSLYLHTTAETAEFTRYISTSADPAVALTFAVDDEKPDQKGYIYKIHADKKMIDVNRSLGDRSPYKAQKEHAAIGFIPFEQIESWREVTYKNDFDGPKIGKETQEKLQQGKLKGFIKNPKFDKTTFQKLRGAGAAPQLAGFSQLEPELKKVVKSLDDYIASICVGKGKSSKRDVSCTAQLGHRESVGPGKQKAPKKPSAQKPGKSIARKFRVPNAAGTAVAFMIVAPFARDLLEKIKQWDSPIGQAVKWFDNAMASLQESIGGPQRDDIYGNELKNKMIKAIGSALQLGFETTWDKRERLAKEAAAREAARRAEEEKEKQRIKGLEDLAQVCEKTGSQQGPWDTQLKTQITQSCQKLETAVKRVQAKEEARKRKRVKPKPTSWFGRCTVSSEHPVTNVYRTGDEEANCWTCSAI